MALVSNHSPEQNQGSMENLRLLESTLNSATGCSQGSSTIRVPGVEGFFCLLTVLKVEITKIWRTLVAVYGSGMETAPGPLYVGVTEETERKKRYPIQC
jgi:hypothetical protein